MARREEKGEEKRRKGKRKRKSKSKRKRKERTKERFDRTHGGVSNLHTDGFVSARKSARSTTVRDLETKR